ncbi:MAG: guanylate kinase [Gammaproteobacteria bacterium]
MSPPDNQRLIVVSGPSGVGKTSVIAEVLALARRRGTPLQLSVSYTTRAARKGEENGKNYHFVSKELFQHMIQQQELLEYALIYGEYYGTGLKAIEQQLQQQGNLILEIDWQGAQQVKTLKLPQTSVFILPPSLSTLKQRLMKRQLDSEQAIERRMQVALTEMQQADKAEHQIVNYNLEQVAEALYRICCASNPSH